ncbi:guanylate kinase [Balneicella halophila]|uniref:Guanylate kinase n=1 Tax=Balneicella halophila TaxID=1537566 RepID=A0A7L4US78_BALHA|nr:guanylate kinase [Balneicella halophila]PVX52638.1 guanylate kinase [Balneicella halophila]
MNKQGKLIICSAPSGSGKTTLVQHLLSLNFDLVFSVSATTRAPRGLEVHGKDYYFLSVEDFKNKIEQDAFVEWEEVYEGIFYGTLKAEVNRLLEEGKNVIFDVDVLGGLNLKKYYKENALALFIAPPSIEELERRLVARATDEKCVIAERVKKAYYELSYRESFDEVIINENLEEAKKDIKNKVSTFIKE